MAEIKNNFLGSKMNRDIDDRLMPNNEYRSAINLQINRSEGSDVGTLQNVLGNSLSLDFNVQSILDDFEIRVPVDGGILESQECLVSTIDYLNSIISLSSDLNPNVLEAIGVLTDDSNDNIYVFLTNYRGTSSSITARNYIYVYNNQQNIATLLVSGAFLNFSTQFPIYGINLIDNLLFWTDNRNQPRKINVTLAPGGHYTSEVQISVAKYNPYETISLIKTAKATVVTTPTTTTFTVNNATGIEAGMTVIGPGLTGSNYTFVTIAPSGSLVTIDLNPTPGTISIGDKLVFLSSTMTNQDSAAATWPGDPAYLQSRYVRFAYRFKFEDGEYSIISPFTQIAYIPQQKGFFVNGDEDAAYRSTVVNFMQNNVQNIQLLVPLPDTYNNISNSYKITEIDILYKESDQTSIKVLESIIIAQNALPDNKGNINVFTYDYQSRKPYKTLPETQTVRVYDKVPVRALSQETAGNRIIYGNYRDSNTSPVNISYTVGIAPKKINYTYGANSFIEYPNHTIKENRNYQVGFILSDKYGRQSSVLLSPVTSAAAGGFGGSTVYSPYKSSSPGMLGWFGDSLIVSVNAPITSGINGFPNLLTGEPGLYAAPNASGSLGFAITSGSFTTTAPFLYTFVLNTGSPLNNYKPNPGDYLRGGNVDYVKVITRTGLGTTLSPYVVTTSGVINTMYNRNSANTPDIKYAYIINEVGWYSYKVVVKQVEQDYYNCYLPGMLNGYPEQDSAHVMPFPTLETNKTAHVVLLNDNINKIPRDLTEVGPDQKQYRSSVLLYGRVNNTGTTNVQYYPGKLFDIVSTIANANDVNMVYDSLSPNGALNLYQLDTQPIVARISTSSITNTIGTVTTTMRPFLSVYETKPVESLLNIYWETSTIGLISDLNEQALSGFDGPTGFSAFTYSQKEHQDPSGSGTVEGAANSRFVTSGFFITSPGSVNLPTAVVTSFSVKDGNGEFTTSRFSYIQVNGEIRIRINDAFTYLKGSLTKDVFTFSFGVSLTTPSGILTNTLTTTGSLTNIIPNIPTTPQNFSVPKTNTNIGTIVSGVNGAFADTTADLYYILTDEGGNPANPATFEIDGVSGVITQSVGSSQTAGIYSFSVRAIDATSSDGSGEGGSLVSNVVPVTITLLTPSQGFTTWVFNSTGRQGSPAACGTSGTGLTLYANVDAVSPETLVGLTLNTSNTPLSGPFNGQDLFWKCSSENGLGNSFLIAENGIVDLASPC